MTIHIQPDARLTLRTCAVMIPPDDRPAANRAAVDGRHELSLSEFLAEQIVRHVAKSFEYRVEKVVAECVPPANFAFDLERLLSADLMVFDLTGHNPDICFAAGLRYMTGRPMICFVGEGRPIPSTLAHVQPIEYGRECLRDSEAEFTRRLHMVREGHLTAARPFFQVHSPKDHKVVIGDFALTRDVLADIEDRIHGNSRAAGRGERFAGNGARSFRSGRY